MKASLRVKLLAAFLAVTVFSFVLAIVFANYFLEKQFKQYTLEKQTQLIESTVKRITDQYQNWGGKWDKTGLENIGMDALGNGLILHVRDKNNVTVWDARTHNNGMCTAILQHMAQNMESQYPDFKGGYTEKTYPVVIAGAQAGGVDIGYYGPFYYSDADIRFLGTLNSLLILAAVISLLVCMAFGVYMAGRLAKPIVKATESAEGIAKGDYTRRISENSGTEELAALTGAVNSLAESLEEQEKLRKRLTADVAHELRTPLTTLQSHVEAMIDGVWAATPERLQSFHEEILRLTKMVGDLQNLSYFEGESLTLTKEIFSLYALLKNTVGNFAGESAKKNVAIELEADNVDIYGDQNKLNQVFINLLSNALKYTQPGGTVNINAWETNTQVVATVADTGMGISKEDLPYVFERFYRTDRSRNRETGGAGIGLAIAKSIVTAHGGRITVQSEPQKGSIFTVYLPKKI